MKFTNLKAFDKHLSSSTPDHLASLYGVFAKEQQERSWLLDFVKKKILQPNMSCTHLASEASFERISQELLSRSLFREPRLLLISLEGVPKPKHEVLASLVTQLDPEVRCLFTGDGLLKSSALYKCIETEGSLFEMGTEKPWEREKSLAEWLLHRATEEKRSLHPSLVNTLVKAVSGSYALLESEWEKLLLYVGEKKAIELADLTAISSLESEESAWALGDALLAMDRKKALETALKSIEQGSALIQILRQMRHPLLTCLKTTLHAEEGTLSTWMEKTPYLKGSILERQLAAGRRFGKVKLVEALRAVDQCELKAKDGVDAPELLLTQLIVRIL